MGAGILPITVYNGILMVLLGKERSNNEWSDFGGSTEHGEQPIETAIREGGEELNGILGLHNKLYKKVTYSMITPIVFNKYTSFLFNIKYDSELINIFNNVNAFGEFYLNDKIMKNHNGLFEKSQIRWFTIDELKSNNFNIRMHFIPIINTIIYNESYIKIIVYHYNKLNYQNKKFNNNKKFINTFKSIYENKKIINNSKNKDILQNKYATNINYRFYPINNLS